MKYKYHIEIATSSMIPLDVTFASDRVLKISQDKKKLVDARSVIHFEVFDTFIQDCKRQLS